MSGDQAPTRHLSYQIKLSVPGMGCIKSNDWPKGFHGKLLATYGVMKSIDSSLKTSGKTILLKRLMISLIILIIKE